MDLTSVDVSSWPMSEEGAELIGRRSKVWLRDPAEPAGSASWLFKSRRAVEDGRAHDEWAEPAIAGLGRVLGIPCNEVRWAHRDGVLGVIARDVRPGLDWVMTPGIAWMEQVTGRSILDAAPTPDTPSEGYTIEQIEQTLSGVRVPPRADGDLASLTAYEVFAGYLVLDALSSCPDRHGENWAVLVDPRDRKTHLAPLFDFEGRLGAELEPERRQEVIASSTSFRVYRTTHRPWFFAWGSEPVPTLVQTACRALALAGAPARERWRSALDGVSEATVADLVDVAPGVAPDERRLASRIITANLHDLRKALDRLMSEPSRR